ncbi:MAG: hypothetical protein R3Y65_03505 [Bacillota bacterium]
MVSNDVLFFVKTGHVAKGIGVSDEVIYCVTKSGGTLTTVITEQAFLTRVDVHIEMLEFLLDNSVYDKFDAKKLLGKIDLARCIKTRAGVRCFLKVFKKYRKGNVRIFEPRDFNVFMWPIKFCKFVKEYLVKDKYITIEKDLN